MGDAVKHTAPVRPHVLGSACATPFLGSIEAQCQKGCFGISILRIGGRRGGPASSSDSAPLVASDCAILFCRIGSGAMNRIWGSA